MVKKVGDDEETQRSTQAALRRSNAIRMDRESGYTTRLPPRKESSRRGVWTGAVRAPYPPVFRPYGNNTRETVLGKRDTGMNWYGYDKGIVGSKPVAPLFPYDTALAGQGAATVVRNIPALRPGPHHVFFQG